MGDQLCCSQVRAFYRVYGARHPGNHAFDFEGRRTFDVLLPTAVFLLLIPSIDETIQLFVPGRAGKMHHRCDLSTAVERQRALCPIYLTVADVRQKAA